MRLPSPGAGFLAGILACLPLASALADVPVRVGTHDGYGRVVFDVPAHTDYTLTQQGQHLIVQFSGDTKPASVAVVPRNVLSITSVAGQAELVLAPDTVVRDWRSGERIVIDIWDQRAAPTRRPQASPPAAASGPAPQTKAVPTSTASPVAPAPAAQPAPADPPHVTGPPVAPSPAPQPSAEESPPQVAEPQPAPASDNTVRAVETPPPGLVVPFSSPVGVAAFRRGNAAIVVFDQRLPIDIAAVHDDPVLGTVIVNMLPSAVLLRFRLDPGMALSLTQSEKTWRITAAPDEPNLQPISAVSADARLVLSAAAPGAVVSVADPDTGATLLVGTQRHEGQGVPVERRAVEFTLLPTWQGVAIEPFADTLALLPTQTGFVLTGGTGGLAQSPQLNVAEQLAHSPGLAREFDLPAQPTAALIQRLHQLVAEDAASAPLARGPRREAVARTMISLGLGAEAEAVLQLAAADDPNQAVSARNAALTSMAALIAGRPGEARGLSDSRLPEADDIAFWRAVRLAEMHEGSPAAAAIFAATLPVVLAYPSEITDRVLPLVAETLVAGGQPAAAAALLDARANDATLDLARGTLRAAQSDVAGALTIYDRLAQSRDQLLHGRAAVLAIDLRLASGAIDARMAAERLERLLYVWRGDRRERSLREHLAELRARTGAWRSALSLLRENESLFPEDKTAIHGELIDLFASLLRGDAAEALASLELVSLVDENADLIPPGPDGEALEARLADRLLTLDLPKRAGPVLDKLMQGAPTAVGRANVGTRLAALRLREADPAGALAALDRSAATDLPTELTERRTLLAAAAHARRGDTDRALAALGALSTAAADEARATILERANDWAGAQRALTDYADKAVPHDGKLDDAQRRTLLRLATAAARAGDDVALTALRQRDGSRMESGPLADMFRLLTADPVRAVGDLKRSGQEAALARGLPEQLKALQPPQRQRP
jgi:hypothetical protein